MASDGLATVPGSASLAQPDYWWYRARSELLEAALARYSRGAALVLDVGSADSPSVSWLESSDLKIALDLDPSGLARGGVCGSVEQLPFADEAFDVVCAFDVIEHCRDESLALSEVARVLRPGGKLLLSVPAYQWAWTDFDVKSGHHRRYTRTRISRAVEQSGLTLERATYAFAGTFPMFAAERLLQKFRKGKRNSTPEPELPYVPPTLERALMALCRVDRRLLRNRDLAFGSSVLVAATKPGD